MKKILSVVALSLLCSIAAVAQYGNTKMTIGQDAPDLNYSTPAGKLLSLKDVNKNRYVLLDFWASWCRPCRGANPALVALYKKYSATKFKNASKGFTVYSVSLDKSKDAWIKAIAQDGLVWENHVSDLGSWESEAAAIYGVQYIPQSFLISPEGKIIGKYNTIEEAAADLQKIANPKPKGKKK